jgi:FkbM family methyltransferase
MESALAIVAAALAVFAAAGADASTSLPGVRILIQTNHGVTLPLKADPGEADEAAAFRECRALMERRQHPALGNQYMPRCDSPYHTSFRGWQCGKTCYGDPAEYNTCEKVEAFLDGSGCACVSSCVNWVTKTLREKRSKMGSDIRVPKRWFPRAEPPHATTARKRRRVVHSLLRSARFSCEGAEAKAALLDGRRNAVVVEVGAHDGEDTLAYARRPNVARVHSFEATPWHEASMRARLDHAGAEVAVKVSPRFSAVSNVTRSEPIALYVRRDGSPPRDGAGDDALRAEMLNDRGSSRHPSRLDQTNMLADNRFLFAERGETVSVPVTTLSDAVREHVDLLETDTQGHEFHVLLGAERLIDEFGIDMIVTEFSPRLMHANGANPEEMLDWLHDKGYACFDCTDFHAPPLLGGPRPRSSDESRRSAVETPRTFGDFSDSFGDHYFTFGDVGEWGNLVCLRL